MKRLLLSLLSIFILSSSYAQDLPVDKTTNLISYSEVINQEGSADILYNKAHKWFFSYYKNPHNVVKESDNNKIVAHPRFKILNPKNKKGVSTMGGIVTYNFTVIFKDGRYKYTITNIEWKQNSKFPIEKWKNTSATSYDKKYVYYLEQVDIEMKKVISELKSSIAKPMQKEEDNW